MTDGFERRIVVVGASAGGLDPLERLFGSLPSDSGCIFVVVQHLSPDFRSMMDELLARHTAMPIHRVEDGLLLEPDRVYLNVPRSALALRGLRVVLRTADREELVHRPIDGFFASVAEQHGERALAVLLSGTGTDGLHGCKAIRDHGGKALVQSPAEARFESMPRAVIDAGQADLVAPIAKLADQIGRWGRGEPFDRAPEPAEEDGDRSPMESVLALLAERYDTDFLSYKPATIERRVERRAQLVGATDLDAYLKRLRRDTDELDELYGDLLIEVTAFFRDTEAFERLAEEAIPALVKKLADGETPRVWVAGCASGEEAYSIAMLLSERADREGVKLEAKILATDIHGRSLERATAGIYPESAVARLSDERIDTFFERHGDRVQVRAALRRLVMFNTHDVLRDTPFTRIDLVSCRNLLIYLNTDAQRQVLVKFHFALRRGGHLFLGPSEGVAELEREFDTVDRRWRLYRKKRDAKLMSALAPSLTQRRAGNRSDAPRTPMVRRTLIDEQSLHERRAYRLALERIVAEHAPPGFLLDEAGSVVHIFGDAGELLPMRGGPFSRDIRELIRPELRPVLNVAFQRAESDDFDGYRHRCNLRDRSGDARPCEIRLERVDITDDSRGFFLLRVDLGERFRIVESAPTTDADDATGDDEDVRAAALRMNGLVENELEMLRERVQVLERGLHASEESLQTTIEELEASNEELQSTNEELVASNEELQSTNEELHSVNQELYTVSAEHQRKIEELSEANADIEQLLSVSEIGTLFLDRDLRLRRFTERARDLFDVRRRDVGRRVDEIRCRALLDLAALLREVLETGERRELELGVGDRHQLLRVQPYEDRNQGVGGVLLATVDVTELNDAKRALERLAAEQRAVLEDTESFIVRWRADDGAIVYCNELYAAFHDATPEEMLGRDLRELIEPEQREPLLAAIAEIEPGESRLLAGSREKPDGSLVYAVGHCRAITDEAGRVVEYQSTGQDLSDEYAYRHALERLLETTGDASLDTGQRLERILALGLDYLRLDSAFVSRIDGEDYHVVAVAGEAASRQAAGDVLPLEETVCAKLPEESRPLAITHLGESALADHPCRAATGIESFIGVRLVTAGGRYGSVAFSSTAPREQPFTVAEEGFVLLASGWIAYLVDSGAQLERFRDENAYYQSLYQNLPVMVALADAGGELFEVSDEWLAALGRERAAVLGREFVEFVTEDGRERVREAIRRGEADAEPVLVRRADGREIACEMDCLLRAIGTRRDVRLIVLTDVSERDRAFDEIERRNRQLAQINESLNQFAFVASHDLQEPLRKIRQFSSFLVEDLGGKLEGDDRYHLDVIVDSAARMSALIRDLLDYSRASRGELARETVALDVVVEQLRRDLQLPLEEAGARLEADELPEVSGDPILLGQLFANLVGNAIKYRDPERPLIVRLRHVDGADGERLLVEDNGIGFDPSYSERIFEPFTRLHGAKEYGGSGIGLAICTTVCEKHGWRLSAQGRPGEGSVFAIDLSPDGNAGTKP